MNALVEPTGITDSNGNQNLSPSIRDRLFCFVDGRTKVNIEQRATIYALERTAPQGSPVSEMRRCGISPAPLSDQTDLETLCVPGVCRERFVYRIVPEDTFGVYVADHRAYLLRYYELDAARRIAGANGLTDAELDECARAFIQTAVPLAEYEECGLAYELPVALLDRDIRHSEVSLLGAIRREKKPKSRVGTKPHRRRAW